MEIKRHFIKCYTVEIERLHFYALWSAICQKHSQQFIGMAAVIAPLQIKPAYIAALPYDEKGFHDATFIPADAALEDSIARFQQKLSTRLTKRFWLNPQFHRLSVH